MFIGGRCGFNGELRILISGVRLSFRTRWGRLPHILGVGAGCFCNAHLRCLRWLRFLGFPRLFALEIVGISVAFLIHLLALAHASLFLR
jgi:hypothetical protein